MSPPDSRLPSAHHRHRVEWVPWQAGTASPGLNRRCADCSSARAPEVTWGSLLALPGQPYPRTTLSSRARSARTRPAGPVLAPARLVAFRCGQCRSLRAYDLGVHGEDFLPLPLND